MTEDDEKKRLIDGLRKQIEIMESNAGYMHKLFPELSHHKELIGAAQITQDWLDNIDGDL